MSQLTMPTRRDADPSNPEVHTLPRSQITWERVYFASASALLMFALLLALRPVVVHLVSGGDHYVYLANHMVQGNLNVDDLPSGYGDYVPWEGHKYLPFGPLPAVVLIPFLPFLNVGLPLITVEVLFSLLNVFLLWRVLSLAGVVAERRKWAVLLFFGGTVYLSTVIDGTSGNSWLFAHVLTLTFTLLAVGEILGKRRPWLVGLLLGLVGATRLTAIFSLPFFIWLLWRGNGAAENSERSTPAFARQIALMGLGLAGPVALLGAYNYLRFSNPLESGYALAVLYNPVLDQARSQGLFSLVHVPKNLFMLLLQGPLPYPSENAPVLQFPYAIPSPWGMGIFFTTPAFVYAFCARLKEPLVQACWLAVGFVLLPLVTYYGVGWVQFGYRYALDFIPFLLILTALGFPAIMSNKARALVLASLLVNLWGTVLISIRPWENI